MREDIQSNGSTDHFLDALSLEKGYTSESLPSPNETERLHRLAFDVLCKAASNALQWGVELDNIYWGHKCVILKSRLCSTFELDRLVQLAKERGCGTILIIDFQMKNLYRYGLRLEHKVASWGLREWYKPRSWKDIEKAKEDEDIEKASNEWESHLDRLLKNGDEIPRVTRLVMDPFDSLYLVPYVGITMSCQTSIDYLLRRLQVGEDLNKEEFSLKGRYVVLQYEVLRRYLAQKYLEAGQGTCDYSASNGSKCCVFKYWEELQAIYVVNCEVCGEGVVSGHPAYTCYLCSLTLHKSCAVQTDVAFEGFKDIEFLRVYPNNCKEMLPCNLCTVGGRGFSPECMRCLFKTHLKCRVLPTVLAHDGHKDSLSMVFINTYTCKACGSVHKYRGSYSCHICEVYYDIECLSLVREVEHEHVGHRHMLKLKYSHDGIAEESYWCDVCYEDMDPQNWFYSCQDCPYYVAHPNCVRLSTCPTLSMCAVSTCSGPPSEDMPASEDGPPTDDMPLIQYCRTNH